MRVSADELYGTISNFPKLRKDDTFNFSCMRCGNCCKFYTNILLNPLDIFRASKYLSLAPQGFIDKYCDIRQDSVSKLPYVKFTVQTGDESCYFFNDGKCSIHEAKPASCALYPAGRILNHDLDGLAYFLQPSVCEEEYRQSKAIMSLSTWLNLYGVADDEGFTMRWHKWIHGTAVKIKEIFSDNEIYPSEAKNTLYSFLCVMMYMKYDIESDFAAQFIENCEETDGIIEMMLLASEI